jgi:tripartite-type tricarboxylate transporter receptor subunit TctC
MGHQRPLPEAFPWRRTYQSGRAAEGLGPINCLHCASMSPSSSMPDLLAGRVQLMFGPLSALQPQVNSGALRLLAVLAPERSAAFPDVPTMREAGYAGVAVPTWQALYVSTRVVADRQQQLARAVAAAASRPDMKAELDKRLLVAKSGSPQELAATISRELAAWSSLIDEYKLTAD